MEYQASDGSKSGMLENLVGIEGLRSSVEPCFDIQKVRIEHPASRAVLLGFTGSAEIMAGKMERVLFMNLAQEIRKAGQPSGFIQKVDVPRRWQNQGIGSSMVLEFFRVAGTLGIQTLFLDVCPADENRLEDLVLFYERLGFVQIREGGEDQFPPPFIMKADLGSGQNG